jgi:hypothetical protein
MVVWVVGCAVAAWWQVGRAMQGNQYSYLYSVEWPVFGGSGIFCWWAMLHSDRAESSGGGEAASVRRRANVERERADTHLALRDREHEDAELAAYNDHLAHLAASGKRKGWRT